VTGETFPGTLESDRQMSHQAEAAASHPAADQASRGHRQETVLARPRVGDWEYHGEQQGFACCFFVVPAGIPPARTNRTTRHCYQEVLTSLSCA
jgi:hypothetical protein